MSDLDITVVKNTLKVFNNLIDALCKDIMLLPRDEYGNREGKLYPPELESFYKYFRHRLIRLQGEVDDLSKTLAEFEDADMQACIEYLTSFRNCKR